VENVFNIGHGEQGSLYGVQYLLTQPWVWGQYLRLFLWPSGQNADPDVPSVTQISDPRFWGTVIVLIGFGILLVDAGLSRRRACRPFFPLAVGLGWFALTLLPSSVLPLPDPMAEHRVYLSLAGLCIGGVASVTLLFHQALLSPQHLQTALGGFLGVACILSVATLRRNQVWASEELFWGDICSKNSTKLRAWLNYAGALAEAGKNQLAENAYSRSIELQPSGLGFANLALLQLRSGFPEKALETSLKALNCSASGYDFFVLGVIGECFLRLRKWAEAVPYFEGSLRVTGGYLNSLKLLGVSHLALKNPAAAREVFQRGLTFHPGNPELLAGLAEAERHLQVAPPPSFPPTPSQTSPPPFKLQLGLGR
jgi:Tfp pilus assembly protein PilF